MGYNITIISNNTDDTIFTVPTLPKLVLNLRGVKDWEEFGVFLLPEAEIDALEVLFVYTRIIKI